MTGKTPQSKSAMMQPASARLPFSLTTLTSLVITAWTFIRTSFRSFRRRIPSAPISLPSEIGVDRELGVDELHAGSLPGHPAQLHCRTWEVEEQSSKRIIRRTMLRMARMLRMEITKYDHGRWRAMRRCPKLP